MEGSHKYPNVLFCEVPSKCRFQSTSVVRPLFRLPERVIG